MPLVRIVSFDEVNKTVDIIEEGVGTPVSENAVAIGTLPHVQTDGVDVKILLKMKTTGGTIESFYPMAGGEQSQKLHQLHLLSDTLVNVQDDATARGISIDGKTQEQLVIEIIQHECGKQNVDFLL